MKHQIPINTVGDCAKTVCAHYHKAGYSDFRSKEAGNPTPHTAILEIEMEEPKIMQLGSYAPNGFCAGKVVDADGIAPTVMENHGMVTAVVEPAVLTPIRTEEQRQLRKQGIDTFRGRQLLPRTDGVCNTITTVQKDNLLQEPCVIGSMQANAMRGSIDGVSPCLTEAMGKGGGQIPMIVQNPHGFNKGGVFDEVAPTVTSSAYQDNNHLVETIRRKDDIEFKEMPDGNIHAYRANDLKKSTAPEWQITNADNIHPTITTSHEPKVLLRYRIRKLTPTECFRLMGVDDSDIEKLKSAKLTQTLKSGKIKEKPMPKTALYKMAGNSIAVDVLYHIFKAMFIDEPPKAKPIQKTLFDI